MSIVRVPADNYVQRFNNYVPAMQCDANVQEGGLYRVNFGAPPAADADYILAAYSIATAGTTTTFAATLIGNKLPARYGQTISLVLSGAGTPTVTVKGRDYLGQRMTEVLTGAGTTTVYGKKAFKYVDSVTFTAVAATTMTMGITNRLGLPYKTVRAVNEQFGGANTQLNLEPAVLTFHPGATDLAAGTSHWCASPVQGFISKLDVVVLSAIGTGGNVTVKVGGTAVTGLTCAVANSATAGTVYTDTPTDTWDITGYVAAGGAVELVLDSAFATSGDIRAQVHVTPTGIIPAILTDPQTTTLGDPRGLYIPVNTLDGTTVVAADVVVDNWINSSGNGGLHGIRHVVS